MSEQIMLCNLKPQYEGLIDKIEEGKDYVGTKYKKYISDMEEQLADMDDVELQGRFREYYNEAKANIRKLEILLEREEEPKLTNRKIRDIISLMKCMIAQKEGKEKWMEYFKQSYVGCFVMMAFTSHFFLTYYYPLFFLFIFIIPFCIQRRSKIKFITYFLNIPAELLSLGLWITYYIQMFLGNGKVGIPTSVKVCGFILNLLLIVFLVVFFIAATKVKNLYVLRKGVVSDKVTVKM